MHRVLETLEGTDRRILGMLLDESLGEREVAERTSLKAATVRQRKRRMILKPGERLRDHWTAIPAHVNGHPDGSGRTP